MWIVYRHTNVLTGMSYIGFTQNSLLQRWQGHLKAARNSSRAYFHNAIMHYGTHSWRHDVLVDMLETQAEAAAAEVWWIAKLRTFGAMGYNMTHGGEGANGLRHPHTEAAKEKIRVALRGRPVSQETREKIRRKVAGCVRTPEQREKMSIARKNSTYVIGAEGRQKIRERHLGRKCSPATLEKMRNSARRRWDAVRATQETEHNNDYSVGSEHDKDSDEDDAEEEAGDQG